MLNTKYEPPRVTDIQAVYSVCLLKRGRQIEPLFPIEDSAQSGQKQANKNKNTKETAL